MFKAMITNNWGKGRGSHNHVVFIDEENKTGWTSVDNGHSHAIQWVEEAGSEPTGLDGIGKSEFTGYRVLVDGDKPHEHGLMDYETDVDNCKDSEITETKDEKVERLIRRFQAAGELNQDFVDKAEESNDFFKGKQWKDSIRADVTSEGRCCLTYNMVRPFIRTLLGLYDKNKSDITYKPTEKGDKRKAEFYTRIAKKKLSTAKFWDKEYKAVKDQGIAGRGVLRFEEDYEESLYGKLKVKRIRFNKWLPGEHEEEDLSDMRECFYWEWYPRKEMEMIYDVENIPIPKVALISERKNSWTRVYGHQYDAVETQSDTDFYDEDRDLIQTVVCHEKIFRRIYKLVYNNDKSQSLLLDGWKLGDAQRFKSIPNIHIFRQKASRMKETVLVGHEIVSEEYLDNSWNDHQFVAYYADKTDDDIVGMVEDMKDPQREHNKARSQMVDILRRCAHYNMFYDARTFASDTEAKRYARDGAKAGGRYKVRDVNRVPVMSEGVKVPNELIMSSELAMQDMEAVTLMREELRGGLSKQMPGYAMIQLIEEGMKGLTYIFKGIAIAKRRIGKMLIKYIQNMPREEIYRILMRDFEDTGFTAEKMVQGVNQETGQPEQQLQQVPFGEWTKEEIDEILDKDDVDDYDVEVIESRWSATYRLAAGMALMDMINQGAPINPLTALRYLDLPEFDKVAQETEQMMQQQQQQNMIPYQTEILKTQINAQGGQGEATPQGNV